MTCDYCRKPYAPDVSHAPCEARAAAFKKASAAFGDGAFVGYGLIGGTSSLYYVGQRKAGTWLYLGAGNDWDEAFKNVRQVAFAFAGRLKLIPLPSDKT